MSDLDDGEWTMEDHLREGRSGIITILETYSGDKPRVCFHFYPQGDGYGESWGMEADYCQLAKREFDALNEAFEVDFVGGWAGVEAWQNVLPSEEWLQETLPVMWELAQKTKLSFDGWTFEPSGGAIIPICVSTSVYNGDQLDAPLPASASRSFDGLKSWLERRVDALR